MGWLIVMGLVVVALIVHGNYSSSKANKLREETIARRKRYVESMSPTARIIVNNGAHIFFKDDEQQVFGLGEDGKTYSFSGLESIRVFNDAITFIHKDDDKLIVGKDPVHEETTVSLDHASAAFIAAEMLPILRRNLHAKLEMEGVSPTHEYEHEGSIWGCDINARKFYTTQAYIDIFEFSNLRRVTIEDVSNNSLCDRNYIINVFINDDNNMWWDDLPMYEIYFDWKDSTYHNLLSMFKGIQNRK